MDLGFTKDHNYYKPAIAPELVSRHCGYDELEFKEVSCEKYKDHSQYESCFMNNNAVIDSANFIIADLKDEDVGGVIFEENKKIEYLPVKIYMQFPFLYIYLARGCSIKQITKENFEKLDRVVVLDLSQNNIQKIRADTFNGVPNLSNLLLSE